MASQNRRDNRKKQRDFAKQYGSKWIANKSYISKDLNFSREIKEDTDYVDLGNYSSTYRTYYADQYNQYKNAYDIALNEAIQKFHNRTRTRVLNPAPTKDKWVCKNTAVKYLAALKCTDRTKVLYFDSLKETRFKTGGLKYPVANIFVKLNGETKIKPQQITLKGGINMYYFNEDKSKLYSLDTKFEEIGVSVDKTLEDFDEPIIKEGSLILDALPMKRTVTLYSVAGCYFIDKCTINCRH